MIIPFETASRNVVSCYFIIASCIAITVTSSSLAAEEKTLGGYMDLSTRNIVRMHYQYDASVSQPIAPMVVPDPYEATIRSYVPVVSSLRELFACRLTPVPDEEHPGAVVGCVSIELVNGYAMDAAPDATFRIEFFRTRKEVLINGKLWRISDSFWRWLHSRFAFSGIELHLAAKEKAAE